jgi:signal transduction histidine kinase
VESRETSQPAIPTKVAIESDLSRNSRNVPPSSWHGLLARLAAFYVLVSLPALLLIQLSAQWLEQYELQQQLSHGGLTRGCQRMASWLTQDDAPHRPQLLNAAVSRLLADETWLDRDAINVLRELSAQPFHVRWTDARSRDLAQIQSVDGGLIQYRIAATCKVEGAATAQFLQIILKVPSAWRKMLRVLRFEWPIFIGYPILLGVASAWFLAQFVTRRLRRIEAASSAWTQGNFLTTIGDESGDELGRLSRHLDRVAENLKELVHARAQLATLTERHRLARDLHDTVKQKLFAQGMQLNAALTKFSQGDTYVLERMRDSLQLTEQMQKQMNVLLFDLRTDDTTAQNVSAQLVERAHAWAQRADLRLQLEIEPQLELDLPSHDNLLAIAEEAFANVVKHSGARTLRVHFAQAGDDLWLQIADDGLGLASAGSGMGLANMRERASELRDGRYTLLSEPGQGTTIEVRFKPQKI